mgnify:CR=1 FL=1
MNPLLSVVERKLEALPVPVQLVLPDGAVLGPPDPRVRFVAHDKTALAHLAEGAVGVLGPVSYTHLTLPTIYSV